MGASSKVISSKGYSVGEVFDDLCASAEYESGHGSYTGNLSSYCRITRCARTFENVPHTQKEIKERRQIIDGIIEDVLPRLDKRDFAYINNGVVEYHIITTKIVSEKDSGTPKFELGFAIHSNYSVAMKYDIGKDKVLAFCKTKKEAREKLMSYVKDYPHAGVLKEYRRVSGSVGICHIEQKVKVVSKPPKTVPKGAVVKPVYDYTFFGWVPE